MGLKVVIAATIIMAAPFSVAPAAAETLEDALSLAYRTNPTIRAERARMRATREAKAQAWAGALPQISASGSLSKVDSSQTSNFAGPIQTDSKFEPQSLSFDAEQPIFTGFRNYHAIKQAGARIRAGGAQLAIVEQQILRDVAGVYFDVQLNMAVFELNQRNVEVLFRQQEMAAARFEVGEITLTDVAQADARLAAARADLTTAQGSLAIARASYTRLVGQAPSDLEPVNALPLVPDNQETSQALAREFAPALIAAHQQSEISRRDVSIAQGALLPSVSLTAGYQFADEPSNFISRDEQFVFGARASMPLFLGGLNYSRIREAKALHDSDRSRINEAERQVEENVTAAWERLVVSRAVIKSSETAAEANALALRGVSQEALLGTRTTLDVLNAEQELLNAKVVLARAVRDAQAAAYSLLAAIGILTPEAVGIDQTGAENAFGGG